MEQSLPSAEFEQLPDLYQRWVEQLLPSGIPRERNATCQDCAMCSREGGDLERDMGYYDRSLKCCTYFPDLPNFLAGRAVSGDNPGAVALRAFIEGADGRGQATLRVVRPNEKIATLYDRHNKTGFGRDPELLCPYAIDKDGPDGPLCGIWKQRNAVCTTFFCKHGRGLTGFRFWQTLRGLLTQLEWSLSWWAITQLIDEPAQVFRAGLERVNGTSGIALRGDGWKHWKGGRTDFYTACADRVEALSADEAIAIGGNDARLYQLELEARFRELNSGELPARPRVAPYSVLHFDGQRATVQALTSSEPFQVPAALVPLLSHFDGRPADEALEAIRTSARVRLEPSLVRRLYDFGVLEDVSE